MVSDFARAGPGVAWERDEEDVDGLKIEDIVMLGKD